MEVFTKKTVTGKRRKPMNIEDRKKISWDKERIRKLILVSVPIFQKFQEFATRFPERLLE